MRIHVIALLVLVLGCASRPQSQTLKTENRRLQNELADSRRYQAATEEKLKALQAQVAQLEQANKDRDSELAKLRTESSASSRDLAEARGRAEAADKRKPTIQCPQGTVLDATGTACVPTATPPVTPPAPPVAPPVPPAPVIARIIKITVEGDAVVCVLGAGSEHGVAKTWRAQFLRGSTSAPLAGGRAEILRVDKRTTTIKVKMTRDAVGENPSVQLSPAP